MREDAGEQTVPVLVVAACLVVVGAGGVGIGPAAAAVPAGQPQAGDRVVVTQELRLTPDQSGRIDVQWTFEVPPDVVELSTRVPSGAENVRLDGFGGASGREYEWDGRTERPSLTFTVPANETGASAGPEGSDGRYVFVDTGEWAIVRTYQAPVSFTYRQGTDVSVVRRNASAGPGVVGQSMAFLGAHETEQQTAADQTVRLVVPEAADLRESRAEILESVTAAAESLRVGDRDERVLMIAAPDTVAWGVEGLQSGERDFYVTADETVDTPRNVWLHEYVHTRQDFRPGDETEWLTEATAQYYAAHLTLRQERVEFEQFRRHLERGADRRHADVVLADERTWGASGNYEKGALVAGDLDRRLRLATNGTATFQTVFRQMNGRDEASTQSTFLRLISETAGESLAEYTREQTETDDVPSMWSRAVHQDVFGQLPASMRYGLPADPGAFRVTGPYRNTTLADATTLVTNETVRVNATATNVGGRDGAYNLTLLADGRVVDFGVGRLGPGESTTVPMSARLRESGRHVLATNGDRRTVEVRRPSRLSIAGLGANRSTVDVGGSVALTATVENAADRPGETRLVVRRDGDPVARPTVRLPAGDVTSVTVPVDLPGPGSYTLAAGNRSVEITARTPTPTAMDTPTTTDESDGSRTETTTRNSGTTAPENGASGVSGPGFGVFAVLAALVGLSLLFGRLE
jgi:hypothetical protein